MAGRLNQEHLNNIEASMADDLFHEHATPNHNKGEDYRGERFYFEATRHTIQASKSASKTIIVIDVTDTGTVMGRRYDEPLGVFFHLPSIEKYSRCTIVVEKIDHTWILKQAIRHTLTSSISIEKLDEDEVATYVQEATKLFRNDSVEVQFS